MLDGMRSGAHFSRCRQFRYALWREWDQTLPVVMMIGLNPSTADATRADRIVAVWGNDGAFRGRSAQIRSMFQPRLFVIRMNGSGEPAHPLYLPKRLTPIAWPGVDVRQSRDG